jgi:hypothetical protein
MGPCDQPELLRTLPEAFQERSILVQPAKAAGGPPPCGESGCTAFHHPALHMQRTGWSGSHGGVYTITKEDSKEADLDSTSDYSEEPVEDQIKQGAGDMRACGPCTFTSVDYFITNGEVVLINCAAPNANKNIEFAIKENAESAEIDTKDVIEIDQIDLSSKLIESTTEIKSVSAEIAEPRIVTDPVVAVVEPPSAVADPVVTGKSANRNRLSKAKYNQFMSNHLMQ